MRTRLIALILGIVFVVIGGAGFIPSLLTPTGEGNPRVFGLFPINDLENVVHLIFGIWGIVAYTRFDHARLFARITAVVYAVLAVMGLFMPTSTVFGLMPVYSNDVWLHAALAIVAAFAGFGSVRQTTTVAAQPGQYRDERPRRTGT